MEDSNVAKTYFEMTKLNGLSDREATRQICEAVGLKFLSGYADSWPKITNAYRAIPPAVVKEMQQRVATYAAKKAGIQTSPEKAKKFASFLSPKVKPAK